jgi:hypothetical protein
MTYHPDRTPSVIAFLKTRPGVWFTAALIEEHARVSKKFVRRGLTVDDPRTAQEALPGVEVEWRNGQWRYRWIGPDQN